MSHSKKSLDGTLTLRRRRSKAFHRALWGVGYLIAFSLVWVQYADDIEDASSGDFALAFFVLGVLFGGGIFTYFGPFLSKILRYRQTQ